MIVTQMEYPDMQENFIDFRNVLSPNERGNTQS